MRTDMATGSVVVRRCALTVSGRGGWSWGAEPTRYLEGAMAAIDRALRQAVAEADLPDDVELRLVEPVRLVWRRDRTLDDAARQALVSALREAALTAGPDDAAVAIAAASRPADPEPVGGSFAGPTHDPAAAGRLAALLAEWSRSGRLPALVAAWPAATVGRWVRAVAAAASAADAVELGEEAVVAIAETLWSQLDQPRRRPQRAVDRLLVVSAALVSAAGDRPVAAETVRRAARAVGAPLSEGPADAGSPEVPAPDAAGAATVACDRAATTAPWSDPTAVTSRPVAAPGLPFLVLVQLARLGYLDALSTVAAVSSADAGSSSVERALAGALAGKVLPPPRRGWSRSPAEAAAVLLAAGLRREAWDRAAYDVRRHADTLVAPLHSALAALYANSLSAGGVEISETVDGLILGEAEGCLPIAWVGDRAEAADILSQLGDPLTRASDRFAPQTAALHERRGFPGVDLPALERHLGAAVGTALGSLAMELWDADDTDAPMLALDRLADLEVELRPRAARDAQRGPVLTIAIPRGQRWLDLHRAGLLDRWSVPWADGGWELVSW